MTDRRSILVVGGTSGIGRAVADAFADDGYAVVLAGRSADMLDREARDLALRHRVPVEARLLDVTAPDTIHDFIAALETLPDVVVSAVGAMGRGDPGDTAEAKWIAATNLVGPALVLGGFAEAFARRGSGVLVGISSVAGDRGRASNIPYGAAKAGFTAYLSGLRQRLNGTGVEVLTVKPGFVRTRMTAGMDLPARLTASPDRVARDIRRAVRRKQPVLYTPGIWRLVMAIVRLIPERIFRRLRF